MHSGECPTYVPPPAYELLRVLGDLESFLHDISLPPLAQIALVHYQFEAIHPFLDGNGRVGRLLITLFLVQRAVIPAPLLYLSAFFEATRQDYYERLWAVTDQGAWSAWLEYFFNGVTRQAEDALNRAARINTVLADWRLRCAGFSSRNPVAIIDLLAENPYWSATRVAERLGLAYSTAMRAINRLVDLGVMAETSGSKRNRVYCASPILEILEEPAQLTPTE